MEALAAAVGSRLEALLAILAAEMSIYSSFLIRCWTRRDAAEPTYVVEHVQSGQQFRSTQLDEAFVWIRQRSEESAPEEKHDHQ